jgi:hypothetical protein
MDPRLQYSPEQYHNKLTEYAAYTIDVDTPVGTFRQKANKQDNVIVIENGHGNFKIHMSYQPIGHFVDRSLRNPDMTNEFSAVVKINNDIIIEIERSKFTNYFSIGWYILLGTIAVINILNAEPWFSLLLLPLIPLAHLIQKVHKKRLKALLVDFMNDIITT